MPALRASPQINDQFLTNGFGPIRSNQRLITFDTLHSHGDPPLLIRTVAPPMEVICIDTDQERASFAPLRALQCGGLLLNLHAIPFDRRQRGSASPAI